MSKTSFTFKFTPNATVDICDIAGPPKRFQASDQLRHAAKQAGTAAVFQPPDDWVVDVPNLKLIEFKLGAGELIVKFSSESELP